MQGEESSRRKDAGNKENVKDDGIDMIYGIDHTNSNDE